MLPKIFQNRVCPLISLLPTGYGKKWFNRASTISNIVEDILFCNTSYFCWWTAFCHPQPTSGDQNTVKKIVYPPFISIFWKLSPCRFGLWMVPVPKKFHVENFQLRSVLLALRIIRPTWWRSCSKMENFQNWKWVLFFPICITLHHWIITDISIMLSGKKMLTHGCKKKVTNQHQAGCFLIIIEFPSTLLSKKKWRTTGALQPLVALVQILLLSWINGFPTILSSQFSQLGRNIPRPLP